MKENTYRLLAKVGSFWIIWIILEGIYKIVYPMFEVLGLDYTKWITFSKEMLSSSDLFVYFILPIIILIWYSLIGLTLAYFGWKKKDNSN